MSNIAVYIKDHELILKLKRDGVNISEICQIAIVEFYNKKYKGNPNIKSDLEAEIKKLKGDLTKEIKDLKAEKEEELAKVEQKLKDLNYEELVQNQLKNENKRKEVKPMLIKEAMGMGIKETAKIMDYVEQRFKEMGL